MKKLGSIGLSNLPMSRKLITGKDWDHSLSDPKADDFPFVLWGQIEDFTGKIGSGNSDFMTLILLESGGKSSDKREGKKGRGLKRIVGMII